MVIGDYEGIHVEKSGCNASEEGGGTISRYLHVLTSPGDSASVRKGHLSSCAVMVRQLATGVNMQLSFTSPKAHQHAALSPEPTRPNTHPCLQHMWALAVITVNYG